MFTLFKFEEQFGLTVSMPFLHLNKDPSVYDHAIKEMLDDCYECKSKLTSGEISHEEYIDWKLKYPEKSALLLNRKPI